MEYHPDKTVKLFAEMMKVARETWDDIASKGQDEDFETTFKIVEWKLKPRIDEIMKKVGPLIKTMSRAEALNHKELIECTTWMQAAYWAGMDVILREVGFDNYSRLLTDRRYQFVVNSECALHNKSSLELNTIRVLRYMVSTYQHFGKKLFTVSPGLSFTLQHTELRKMPAELLTLPYPCIYLVMPSDTYNIYNNETGVHFVEGAYIVEDKTIVPRSWKIMLTGLANENSVHEEDDALYHYNIILEDGKSLEECIEATVKIATEGLTTRGVIDGCDIVSGDLAKDELDIFNKTKDHLIKVFKYAACVCLYATHPDAEVDAFNASPEYKSLYNRALKAKGDKRKKLFSRASKAKGESRILLGGSVTVSREDRAAAVTPRRKGSTHKVRTYVQGHWQHYRVKHDTGEYGRKYILKKAYWKGAKDLPVTEKRHHVK